MSKPLGWGVVGAGSIGIRAAMEHFAVPDVHDRAVLAAVCDPVEGRASAAGAKYGIPHAYDSYEALLADDTVDLVTICSPIGLHYDQGLAAIEAGKHIHFNKTMTVTSAEAEDLIAKADAKGLKIVASPGQMTRPVNQEIRRIIQDGGIGDLVWSHTGAGFGTYHEEEGVRKGSDLLSNVNPSWYWRKPGGGPMYDMTVYGLHTLTGILGPAHSVVAMSAVRVKERFWNGQAFDTDADDNTFLILDFGDGVFSFVYGAAAGGLNDFGQPAFYGTKGVIRGTDLNGTPIARGDGHWAGPHVVGAHDGLGEEHVFEDMMQLVDYVSEGIQPFGTAAHAAHVIEVIEAGYRAAETGQKQSLRTRF